jgi:hypothetical protein
MKTALVGKISAHVYTYKLATEDGLRSALDDFKDALKDRNADDRLLPQEEEG